MKVTDYTDNKYHTALSESKELLNKSLQSVAYVFTD
jgi:hypothetical protein